MHGRRSILKCYLLVKNGEFLNFVTHLQSDIDVMIDSILEAVP